MGISFLPANAAGWRRALLRLLLVVVVLVAAVVGFLLWCTVMPGTSHRGALSPLTAVDTQLRERLRGHVTELAGTIGERNTRRPDALAAAAGYIRRQLERHGYTVAEQCYRAGPTEVVNLEATLGGGELADEIVVVGAHYDSAPGTPGADDNASAVAALLELAGRLRERSPRRTVRFVAFTNEEPPWFQTGLMGSVRYARRCKERDENVVAMLGLEMLGYFDPAADSQHHPPLLGWFYPDRGDFIAFVGNLGSRRLVRTAVDAFREHARFPSEGLAAPAWAPGVGLSDHWSFWQSGYPAIMATDTAFFRNPHYHRASDRPDTLDYERLARVTAGLAHVVEHLANRR